MNHSSAIETILFVASKPLSAAKIAKALEIKKTEAENILFALQIKYNQPDSGINIINNQDEWQMVSGLNNKAIAEKFIKAEHMGDLTRPQLETLTIISYCGPIARPEIEQIRGVNCGIILRNLKIRGLIKETDDSSNLLPQYQATIDYVRHLGLSSIIELPDYEQLRAHPYLKNSEEGEIVE